MIEIRPARLEDFEEPPVYRVRAWTVTRDDRVIGIGGVGFPPDLPPILWSTITEELRALPVTLHRAGLLGLREAKRMGVKQMYATTAQGFEAAERWIARLGFHETGEVRDGKKVWVWHEC